MYLIKRINIISIFFLQIEFSVYELNFAQCGSIETAYDGIYFLSPAASNRGRPIALPL